MRRALLLALCAACSSPPAEKPEPIIRLDVPALIDFGQVLSPGNYVREIEVRNAGAVAVPFISIEKVSGDDEIEVALTVPTALAPGFAWPTKVRLSVHATLVKDYRAELVVRSSNAPDVFFTVTAQGVFADCRARPFIDFGAVVVGDTGHATFTLINTSGVTSTASFELSPEQTFHAADAGTFTLLAGETLEVPLSFTPHDVAEHGSTARVRTHALCPETNVQLVGSGMSSVVACRELSVALGYCPLNHSCASQLQVFNHSFVPLQLTELTVGPSPELQLGIGPDAQLPAGMHGTTPDGPPREPGRLTLPITFTPATAGERVMWLTAKTSNPFQPTLSCGLWGWGGGPVIEVTPPLLDFGTLDGGSSTLPFTVRNVGTLDVGPGMNLMLSVHALQVIPLTPAATLDSIAGGFGNGFGPGIAPGEAIELPVTVLPGDAGSLMEWQIQVLSNDIHALDAGLRVRALQ